MSQGQPYFRNSGKCNTCLSDGDEECESDDSCQDSIDTYRVPMPDHPMYSNCPKPEGALKKKKKDKKRRLRKHNKKASSDESSGPSDSGDSCEDYTYRQRRVSTKHQLACKPERSFLYPKPVDVPEQLRWQQLYHKRCEKTHEEFWSSDDSDCAEHCTGKPRRFDREMSTKHAPEWTETYAVEQSLVREKGPSEFGASGAAFANPYDMKCDDSEKECLEMPDKMVRCDMDGGGFVTRTPEIMTDRTRRWYLPFSNKPVPCYPQPRNTDSCGAPPIMPAVMPGPRHDMMYQPFEPQKDAQQSERAPLSGGNMVYGARQNNDAFKKPFPMRGAQFENETSGWGCSMADDIANGSHYNKVGDTNMPIVGDKRMPSEVSGWPTAVDDKLRGGRGHSGHTKMALAGANPSFQNPVNGWNCMGDDIVRGQRARKVAQLCMLGNSEGNPNNGRTGPGGSVPNIFHGYRARSNPDTPGQVMIPAAPAPVNGGQDVNTLDGSGINRRPPTLPATGGRAFGNGNFANEFSVGSTLADRFKKVWSRFGAGNYGCYNASNNGCALGGASGCDMKQIRLLEAKRPNKDLAYDDTPNKCLLLEALKYGPGAATIEGMKHPGNFDSI